MSASHLDFPSLAKRFPNTRKALDALGQAGYRDLDEVAQSLPEPPLLSSAIFVLGFSQDKRHVPKLVRLADDSVNRAEVVRALCQLGGRRVSTQFCHWMISHPNPGMRYEATYGASHLPQDSVYGSLIRVAENADEYPEIRGQAAEGIAYHSWFLDRRSIRYKRLVPILRRLLADDASEVRFWACFAAGTARCNELSQPLRELVSDSNRVSGFWSVGEEASDALAMIDRQPVPDRVPVGRMSFSWET